PAHALVCRYAAFPPGAMVYDACAAPGGKSVALERGGARLLAGDGRLERVGRLVEPARRAGVAIQVAAADLLAAPFRSEALAAVLVDAPCSAPRTMARHPDARWRATQRTRARAGARQRAVLAPAAAPSAPGADAGGVGQARCAAVGRRGARVLARRFLGGVPGRVARAAVARTRRGAARVRPVGARGVAPAPAGPSPAAGWG